MKNNTAKSILYGVLASVILIGIYFVAVGLISEPSFAVSQWQKYWYFIVSLALGFGIQISLYSYLKNLIKSGHGEGKVLGVTGTTSTAAMISCCAHYLANIVPILGIAGALSIIAQYQVKIFWVGLAFNMFGIVFIINKIIKFKKHL